MKSHPVPSTPAAATSRILACIATIGITASAAHALSIEITGAGSYSQDFNTLPTSGNSNTWTDDVTIPGWYASRTTLIASTGSGNSGGLYSFGSTSSTERALGSIGSSSANPVAYGILFQNNSGSAITIDSIAYTGEQWRNGGTTMLDGLTLEYRITATSEGVNGTATITVTAVPVASVDVSLNPTSIVVGATSTGTATTRDASNNVLTGRTVTWSSSNTGVAILRPVRTGMS